MTLKDIIERNNWGVVMDCFLMLYPEQDKNIAGYQYVYRTLKNLSAENCDLYLEIEKVLPENNHDQVHYYISGEEEHPEKDTKGTSYDLAFMKWSEWLGVEIKKTLLESYKEEEIIVHCLYEMTFAGFNEKTIQEALSPPSAEDEYISSEEFFRTLNNDD